LIDRLQKESSRSRSRKEEKSSSRYVRLTANKNWKKGCSEQSVLIHIQFKFSTRKDDMADRLNDSN